MTNITIARLEKAINDCRLVQPPVDYVLGPDLRKLASIWGEMIALRQKTIDLDTLVESKRTVLARWLGAAAGPVTQSSAFDTVAGPEICTFPSDRVDDMSTILVNAYDERHPEHEAMMNSECDTGLDIELLPTFEVAIEVNDQSPPST